MTKRGTKSHTTIAGHTLTWAELTVLKQMRDYLESNDALDAGRSVPLAEIFPEQNHQRATGKRKRYSARRLAELGILKACGIEFENDMVKGKPHDPLPVF
jgi:hypothetical protein